MLKSVASANAILKHYISSSLITVKRHAMVLSFFLKANLVFLMKLQNSDSLAFIVMIHISKNFSKKKISREKSQTMELFKKTTFSESPYFGLHEKFLTMVICKLKVDIFKSIKTQASTSDLRL